VRWQVLVGVLLFGALTAFLVLLPGLIGPSSVLLSGVGALTGLAATAVGAIWLAGQLTRRIRALTETAEKIIQGDDGARADAGASDEVGQLVRTFNSMVEKRISAQRAMQHENERLQDGIFSLLYVAGDASEGDLTVRAPLTEGVLGNVADALNLMLEKVGRLLREVVQTAGRVSAAAMEIQASSEELEEGSVKQVREVVNTTQAVQEMAGNIASVSNHATSAAEAAARANAAAEQGSQAVAQVVEGMERIRQNVQAGARKIKRLGERSQEISSIISTISQISAQTDILALNAAIEAARAGEHGRGFTVVAEEVRKLAERTAAATREIEGLIAGMQAETNESVSAMEHQTMQVEEESRIVSSAGSQLTRIHESSVQSAELISQINEAAKQQVRDASSVVKAMESVQRIAQQAQAATAQTKSESEALAGFSSDLLMKLGKFKMDGVRIAEPSQAQKQKLAA
jgi:twitching motility protein PilJ